MTAAPDSEGRAVLELRAVSKRYGGSTALDNVDFDVGAGEVHALIGENGAGKSTLCKIVSGATSQDSGTLMLEGVERRYTHPSQALRDGIAMVYQETSLVPTMTVAQNIELGDEPMFSRMRNLNIAARQYLHALNFHVAPSAYVSSLGSAQRQMVEIVRALRRNAKVVIFDEPTASLTPEEKEQLFGAILRLRERGVAVIFVSHALEESLQIADRVTVLRDGLRQGTCATDEVTRSDLVQMMVGRRVEYTKRRSEHDRSSGDRPVLRVENLRVGNVVKNMSLSAYRGEIVGIAGLVGAGRSETALVVSGAIKRNRIDGGRIYVEGKSVRFRTPRQAIKRGIVYITEDRKINGFFETMPVDWNIYLGYLASGRRLPMVVRKRERLERTMGLVTRFRIRSVSSSAKVRELSGGNQQKVVLAKSLTRPAQVVIFDEPTRGVDVGAIEEIHELIREVADSGAAVIVISSYLPEILSLSDRVLVARMGRVVAEFKPEEATEEAIMFAAVH